MIKAEIVAHSLSPQKDELISVLATFPRIILAEVNTHRMLSKNTSSSRAIPFFKMAEAIKENPFIPMAWQKHHSGMQGNEYISPEDKISAEDFIEDFIKIVKSQAEEDKVILTKDFIIALEELHKSMLWFLRDDNWHTLEEIWLKMRDLTIFSATMLYCMGGVTKQLANRLLEPFMWTTMLITGSREGWDNFFKLRCPSYRVGGKGDIASSTSVYRSRKDAIKDYPNSVDEPNINWMYWNEGQAEIHMMSLAECIWDSVNESTPKQLISGQWHIPFQDKMDISSEEYINITGKVVMQQADLDAIRVKSSVAMAARTSYTVVGEEKEVNYENLIALHDRLLNQDPPHSSPMEHCARAMSDNEHQIFVKGKQSSSSGATWAGINIQGWCYNLKGFIPYRYFVDNGLVI